MNYDLPKLNRMLRGAVARVLRIDAERIDLVPTATHPLPLWDIVVDGKPHEPSTDEYIAINGWMLDHADEARI